MSPVSFPILAVACLVAPLAGAQSAPDLARILDRLDRIERENRALADEVRALRARIDGMEQGRGPLHPPGGTPPAPPPASESAPAPRASTEERLGIQEERTRELEQVKVEASQKFPIRLAGMALFNTFMNSRQNGGSDYPVVASAPGRALDGATLRQTIIGLEFRGPQVVDGGKVHGSVYMDFFAGGSGSTARLRTGSIQIDWKSRSIMAGIEKPIFNPREPSSLAQVGVSPLTGAGNLWLWLPQVRFEQDFSIARATGVRAQAGIVETHEVGPYSGSNFGGPLERSRPGLEGRFEFFHHIGDERQVEIAPGFHTSQTHAAGASIPSSLFSLDWFFNPLRRLEFTGAFYTGQNVAPLGNGYQQGFVIDDHYAEPVHSRGGWGQITIHAAPRLDFHLFSGQQDDDSADLETGRIGRNLLFGGNLFYRLAPNVIVSLETTQLRTSYIRQPLRINNHYDLALAYLF